nr:hypothetical protein [Amylibacter sp.]
MVKITLSADTFQKLSEFILDEISDGPTHWNELSQKFLEENFFENDESYRWLFSRLVSKMLEEHWIAKASSKASYEIGLTFKGQTVLRHKAEINNLFEIHFKKPIERAEKAAKSKLAAKTKLEEQKRLNKKKQMKIERLKKTAKRKLKSSEKRKNKIAAKSKPQPPTSSKINLLGSGKIILDSIPNRDNSQLLSLWKSNTRGASKSTGFKRNQHMQIISRVEEEWARRIKNLPENEAFKWPSTDVGFGTGGGDFQRQEVSYLKLLGYTVGKSDGLPTSTRQLILDRCFCGQLPPFENAYELMQWGVPKSAIRLRKISYHLAGLAKNFKKMQSRGYGEAIADWEEDLKYLKEKYYIGQFNSFLWPKR